jgi:hypothetical protein
MAEIINILKLILTAENTKVLRRVRRGKAK